MIGRVIKPHRMTSAQAVDERLAEIIHAEMTDRSRMYAVGPVAQDSDIVHRLVDLGETTAAGA